MSAPLISPLAGCSMLRDLHVLYVEDDGDTREQLAHLLARVFRKVSLAGDGVEALDCLRGAAEPPDIIVTDVQMARMNGLQLAAQVKRDHPQIPVVVTSAFNDADYLLAGIGIGVDGYILKPVDFQALLHTVGRCVLSLVQQRQLDAQLHELRRYRDRAGAELALMAELMQRLLRSDALYRPEVRHLLQPCDRVAGDLVVACEAPDGRLFLMLADSIGHGLPAALHLVPVSCMFYEWVGGGRGLDEIVAGLDRLLCERAPVGRFVAAQIACVDFHTGSLQVWNGGVPPGLYCGADGHLLQVFEPWDLPLGVNGAGFRPTLYHCELRPGAELLFYSDGVSEAVDGAGGRFGEERVAALMRAHPGEGFAALRDALRAFMSGAAEDDVSMLGMVMPPQAGRPGARAASGPHPGEDKDGSGDPGFP